MDYGGGGNATSTIAVAVVIVILIAVAVIAVFSLLWWRLVFNVEWKLRCDDIIIYFRRQKSSHYKVSSHPKRPPPPPVAYAKTHNGEKVAGVGKILGEMFFTTPFFIFAITNVKA